MSMIAGHTTQSHRGDALQRDLIAGETNKYCTVWLLGLSVISRPNTIKVAAQEDGCGTVQAAAVQVPLLYRTVRQWCLPSVYRQLIGFPLSADCCHFTSHQSGAVQPPLSSRLGPTSLCRVSPLIGTGLLAGLTLNRLGRPVYPCLSLRRFPTRPISLILIILFLIKVQYT